MTNLYSILLNGWSNGLQRNRYKLHNCMKAVKYRTERFRTVPYSLYIILLFRRERFITVPFISHFSYCAAVYLYAPFYSFISPVTSNILNTILINIEATVARAIPARVTVPI